MARCQCDATYGCSHSSRDCSKKPGTPWGPYFCWDCDQLRIAHIAGQLEELREALEVERGRVSS